MLRKKNVRWKFLFLLIFVFLFSSNGFTAEYENRVFHNVNELYDVSMYEANSVCKDEQGFVWISSKTGILRLAEDNATKYFLPYNTADVVAVELVCKESLLIAYSSNGQFFKYDQLNNEFELIFDARILLDSRHITVQQVLVGAKGDLYISSSLGLFKYHGDTLSLMTRSPHEEFAIEWYDDKQIFVTRTNGIWLFNVETGKDDQIVDNETIDPFKVVSLFYDRQEENLWIGTKSNGLFFFNLQNKSFSTTAIDQFPENPVLDIEPSSDSTVFLGIDGQGLWEVDRSGSKVLNVYTEDVNDPSSLQGDGVYDIYNDESGKVWVCTYTGGASFFKKRSPVFTQIKHQINEDNSLVNNYVNDVLEDRHGNIWFATNNGISKWVKTRNEWQSFYNSNEGQKIVFLSISEGADGKIWAGTYSQGVYVLDETTGQEIAHYSSKEGKSGLIGDFIFDISKGLNNDLWIVGVLENVVRYQNSSENFKHYSSLSAYTIENFKDNVKLIGCTNGLVILNSVSGVTETVLDGHIIQDVHVKGDTIWCGTSGDGLIRYNYKNGEYKIYKIKDGLISDFVNSITEIEGYLWIGTESGLCRFSFNEEKFLSYTSFFPFSNISFSKGAVTKLRNGKLLMGTNKGALMFDPAELEVPQLSGSIFFQDIFISGRTIRDSSVYGLQDPLNELEKITLPYKHNTISLELLSIGISSVDSKFSWKFEGIDENWSVPSYTRMLNYSNLPSGEYELRIRLYNNSLTKLIDERQLKIKIIPPFWLTWWFYILSAFFIAGVLYLIFRYHINLIQQLHSEEKIRFFANTAHEIRTSLTLISGPVNEIEKETHFSRKGRYYLGLAKEQMNHLLKVTTQLLDFQKFDKGKGQLHLEKMDIVQLIEQRKIMFDSYAHKEGLELVYESEVKQCLSALDVGMMEKVMDNLISNAIKYSKRGGKVFLRLDCNKKSWTFDVEDQGIGISKREQRQLFKEFYRSENAVNSEIVGSGIGLLMVKNYVEKHGGTITFESKENIGSKFRIEVPVKEMEGDVRKLETKKGRQEVLWFKEDITIPENIDVEKHPDLKILVVEDNEKLRHFLETSLSDNYIVSTAENGADAWEIVAKSMPDLVISDIMMPKMDGFELCQKMKSTYDTSHIPVILLTSLTDKARQIQGLGLGADSYLTKPFDLCLLISRINSILINRKAVRDRAIRMIDYENSTPIMENELNDQFVKKALEVVRENISNSLFGKEQFASGLNVSTSLLYKKIKSLTGQSPIEFIKTVRLKYALDLLQTRNYNVTEVSERTGFSNVGYFSTVFKKFYKKSPTEILTPKE